eukprot:1177699-Prorocentrum_minimum.AAC.1
MQTNSPPASKPRSLEGPDPPLASEMCIAAAPPLEGGAIPPQSSYTYLTCLLTDRRVAFYLHSLHASYTYLTCLSTDRSSILRALNKASNHGERAARFLGGTPSRPPPDPLQTPSRPPLWYQLASGPHSTLTGLPSQSPVSALSKTDATYSTVIYY